MNKRYMASPSYNSSPNGFQMSDSRIGGALSNIKQGVLTPQTPLQLTGNGPFTLSAAEFATAMITGIVCTGLVSGIVSIVLPATSTIVNVLSDLCVSQSVGAPFGTGTNSTYGQWTTLKVLNENPNSTVVNLVAGDANTNVSQTGCLPLTSCSYTVTEVLGVNSAYTVQVVQNNTSRVQSGYLTVVLATTQRAPQSSIVPFSIVTNFGGDITEFSYDIGSSTLTVEPGASVLISASAVFQLTSPGNSNCVFLIAPPGTGGSSGFIGMGSNQMQDPSGFVTNSFSIAYTNTTVLPTEWQFFVQDTNTNLTVNVMGQSDSLITAMNVVSIS